LSNTVWDSVNPGCLNVQGGWNKNLKIRSTGRSSNSNLGLEMIFVQNKDGIRSVRSNGNKT